jgi:hypothetical protein
MAAVKPQNADIVRHGSHNRINMVLGSYYIDSGKNC